MKFVDSEDVNNTVQILPEVIENTQEFAEPVQQNQEEQPKLDPTSAEDQLKGFDKDFDPMAAPSGLFGLYLPHFMDIVEGLSSKSLKRLITSMVAYPLEDVKPNKNNEKEVMAYKIGQKLLESKYLMIFHTAYQHELKAHSDKAQQVFNQAQDQAKQEVPLEQTVSNSTELPKTEEGKN